MLGLVSRESFFIFFEGYRKGKVGSDASYLTVKGPYDFDASDKGSDAAQMEEQLYPSHGIFG